MLMFSQPQKSCALHYSVDKGQTSHVEAESLTRKLLDTYKCYLLDCGGAIYVWMGQSSSLAQRKAASAAAEVSLAISDYYSVNNFLVKLSIFGTMIFPKLNKN